MEVLIISHGKMAEGVLNTLEFFLGKKENMTAICCYVDGVEPKPALEEYFSKLNDETVVVFTDLLRGSVNTAMLKYLKRDHTYLYAGFNLAMILELMGYTDPTDEDIKNLLTLGREELVDVAEYVKEM